MIVDSDGSACQEVNFNIGTTTTVTRAWNIRVTQYQCSQEDVSGAPGCLQYYTQNFRAIICLRLEIPWEGNFENFFMARSQKCKV